MLFPFTAHDFLKNPFLKREQNQKIQKTNKKKPLKFSGIGSLRADFRKNVACITLCLGDRSMHAGLCSVRMHFKKHCFCFPLPSKGDSNCHLIVCAWNQSGVTWFSCLPLCIRIMVSPYQVSGSCNSPGEYKISHFRYRETNDSVKIYGQPLDGASLLRTGHECMCPNPHP